LEAAGASAQGTGARGRAALRSIAVFEALKGAGALAASLGFFSLLHHDLHHLAVALIGHFGLDPEGRYPAMVLHYADVLADQNVRNLVLLAAAYVLLRFTEAYGLWMQRRWGEWLGALSGALYVPFELRHLVSRPSIASAVVLAGNVAVVGYLLLRLWRFSRGATAGAAGSGTG
jgi:uncharacterized membrane protein (DUF2068 family)